MSEPLDSARGKVGAEYHRESFSALQAENADANEGTLGRTEFHFVQNLRIETYGELTLRNGTNNVLLGALTPLCESEFVITFVNAGVETTVRYAVRAVYNGSEVLLIAIDKTDTTLAPWIIGGIVSGITTTPKCWMTQSGTSIILTVFGDAVYYVSPVALPVTTNVWTVRKLGKQICPTPSAVGFVSQTTGDLFAFDLDLTLPSQSGDALSDFLSYDLGDPIPRRVPLAINAPYFLARDYMGTDPDIAPWIYGSNDPIASLGAQRKSIFHTWTRGWSYRFVAVQTFLDARGNKYTVRSQPSSDFFLKDVIYSPACQYPQPDDYNEFALDAGYLDPIGPPYFTSHNAAGDINPVFLPSDDDFEALKDIFAASYKSPRSEDKLFYIAWYLGWRVRGAGPSFQEKSPYWLEVPASALKQAPMAIFTWNSFFNLPPNTTEIEVYRTAHSEPNEKDNVVKDPLFQKNIYGYAGSVKPDADFTDDVTDAVVNASGNNPEQYNGYLQGEFSGQVVTMYENQAVLSEIRTLYEPQPPTPWIMAFSYDATAVLPDPANFYQLSDFTPAPPAGTFGPLWSGKTAFFYAYVDTDGNQSDATVIPIDLSAVLAFAKSFIIFQFPRGYAPSIASVNLYKAIWDGTNVHYYKIANLSTDNQFYISRNDEALTSGVSLSELSAKPVITFEPGCTIYSQFEDIFTWPIDNHYTISDRSPIRAMHPIMGQLWFFLDDGVLLSNLQNVVKKLESENEYIGCLNRFCACKVDKVVFFLSQVGLYMAEASGLVAFPGYVQSIVLEYLRESLNAPPLTNARRASMGWFGKYNELWLHLPSSIDLGGKLPHRTLVFKFVGGKLADVQNYEFDLTPDFELRDMPGANNGPPVLDPASFLPYPVIFSSGSDSQFHATYFDTNRQQMIVTDLDYQRQDWQGKWSIDKSFAMGFSQLQERFRVYDYTEVQKSIRTLIIRAATKTKLQIITGISKPDGSINASHGPIHDGARVWDVGTQQSDKTLTYRHAGNQVALENMGYAPYIRLSGRPLDDGTHKMALRGLGILVTIKHQHP